MANGGGNFLLMNKVIPGAYINFVSASRASVNMGDRGYANNSIGIKLGT